MKIVQTKINSSNYKVLHIRSLSVNDILPFSIFIKKDNDYVIIIESGVTITDKLYKMLKTKDTLYIAKKNRVKKRYTKQSLFESIQANKNDFKKCISILYEVNNNLFTQFFNSKDDFIDIECMKEIVHSLIYLVKENPNYVKDAMQYFSLDYSLPYHSIHVSLYAIHLGHFLEFNVHGQLEQLGTAGLLHDIGFKKIDTSIKDKKSPLNVDELKIMHQHSKFGGEIAQKNHIHDPYILDAIVHHHESHDGSGYPHQLRSEYIQDFASIICISDSFDALTNERVYRKKYSTFEALKMMMTDKSMENKFDIKFLKSLLQSFMK